MTSPLVTTHADSVASSYHGGTGKPAPVPFQTSFGYYGGSWPLEHRRGPRLQMALYRVLQDGIPRSAWSLSF